MSASSLPGCAVTQDEKIENQEMAGKFNLRATARSAEQGGDGNVLLPGKGNGPTEEGGDGQQIARELLRPGKMPT